MMDLIGTGLALALGVSLAVFLDEVFPYTPAIEAFLTRLFR